MSDYNINNLTADDLTLTTVTGEEVVVPANTRMNVESRFVIRNRPADADATISVAEDQPYLTQHFRNKYPDIARELTAVIAKAVSQASNESGGEEITIELVTGLRTELDGKSAVAHTHAAATTTVAGFMAAADKTKLNGVAASSTANSPDATLLDRANHTGLQAIGTVTNLQTTLDGKALAGHTHADATTTVAGLMTGADKTKLNGVAAAATANSTDATLRDRTTHTGSQAIGTVTNLQTTLDAKALASHTHADATTTVAGFMSGADKTKLNGVAVAATANSTDANLRDRTTHTGTQAIATITNLQTTIDGIIARLVVLETP